MADFGLSKSTYEKMYFRQDKSEGVKLPIKWMALESMEDAVFTEKTDVVRNIYGGLVKAITVITNELICFSGHLESLVGRCSVVGSSRILESVP